MKNVLEQIQVTPNLLDAIIRNEDCYLNKEYDTDGIKKVIENYKKFLFLVKINPGIRIAPTKDIDEVWHMHILYPVMYHKDCMDIFGFILDHNPGYGTKPNELPKLKKTYYKTAEIWETMYGEPYAVDLEKSMKICDGQGGDIVDPPGGKVIVEEII